MSPDTCIYATTSAFIWIKICTLMSHNHSTIEDNMHCSVLLLCSYCFSRHLWGWWSQLGTSSGTTSALMYHPIAISIRSMSTKKTLTSIWMSMWSSKRDGELTGLEKMGSQWDLIRCTSALAQVYSILTRYHKNCDSIHQASPNTWKCADNERTSVKCEWDGPTPKEQMR